jgi:hypothetical protein
MARGVGAEPHLEPPVDRAAVPERGQERRAGSYPRVSSAATLGCRPRLALPVRPGLAPDLLRLPSMGRRGLGVVAGHGGADRPSRHFGTAPLVAPVKAGVEGRRVGDSRDWAGRRWHDARPPQRWIGLQMSTAGRRYRCRGLALSRRARRSGPGISPPPAKDCRTTARSCAKICQPRSRWRPRAGYTLTDTSSADTPVQTMKAGFTGRGRCRRCRWPPSWRRA